MITRDGLLVRREDWPERLESLIRARECVPFAWGTNDCALFAADAIYAMTDMDLARGYRGEYRTARGAARLLAELPGGLSTVPSVVLMEIGFAYALRGDIVLFNGGNGQQLGVCIGEKFVAPGRVGLVAWSMSRALKAWRV